MRQLSAVRIGSKLYRLENAHGVTTSQEAEVVPGACAARHISKCWRIHSSSNFRVSFSLLFVSRSKISRAIG